MEEKMQQLIISVNEVFMRYGIKSVTMDDIARELKISKKTLYKYVSDKNDLVCKVCETHCGMEKAMIEQIVQDSENAVDEIIKITRFVGETLKEVHPSIHYDLQKYYPEAWDLFNEHKSGWLTSCVTENLERGIKEGLFRENLDAPTIARLYCAKIDILFDSSVFPVRQFKFADVHLEMVRYHIRGIANEKGIDYLKKRIKQDNLNL